MSSLYLPDAVCVGNMGCKMEASNGQSDVLRSRNASENVYRPSCGRLQGLAFGYVGSDCILNVADPCFD